MVISISGLYSPGNYYVLSNKTKKSLALIYVFKNKFIFLIF